MRSIQMQEICQRRPVTLERRCRGRQSERMESQSAVFAARSKTWKKIKDPLLSTESAENFVGSGALL